MASIIFGNYNGSIDSQTERNNEVRDKIRNLAEFRVKEAQLPELPTENVRDIFEMARAISRRSNQRRCVRRASNII